MGGFDDRNVRVQLALTPGERFTLDLSGHARWYDGTSTLFHRGALKKGSNDVSAQHRLVRRSERQSAELQHLWRLGPRDLRLRSGGADLDHRVRDDFGVQPWRHRWRCWRELPGWWRRKRLRPVAGPDPRSRPVVAGSPACRHPRRPLQLAGRRPVFRHARHHRLLPARVLPDDRGAQPEQLGPLA
jgi:hypothetical protein